MEDLNEVIQKATQKLYDALKKDDNYPVDLLNKEEKIALLIENQIKLELNDTLHMLKHDENSFFLNEDFQDNIKKLCSLNTVEIVLWPTFIYDKKPYFTNTQTLQSFDRFLYEAQKYKGYVFIQHFSQSPNIVTNPEDFIPKIVDGEKKMLVRYRCAGGKEMFLNTEAY